MQIINDFPLAAKTTIKIGGPAQFYVEPQDANEITQAIAWARERNHPVFILGRGSNVVISDQGWSGLVVNTSAGCDRIVWKDYTADCESGALLHNLVKESVARGAQGLENLGWIPGTVGGAVAMNAGAFGQNIGMVVDYAEYIDMTSGEKSRLSSPQLAFGYRTSIFKGNAWFIVSMGIKLDQGDAGGLQKAFHEVFEQRKGHQPLDTRNCGSVFKNPAGQMAGFIIEQCGLKGFRKNAVMISEKHANFIINTGSASAEDFRSVVQHVQRVVFEKTGILLQPEVVFAGDFDTPLFDPKR